LYDEDHAAVTFVSFGQAGQGLLLFDAPSFSGRCACIAKWSIQLKAGCPMASYV
jgi:hypothetical protein